MSLLSTPGSREEEQEAGQSGVSGKSDSEVWLSVQCAATFQLSESRPGS